MLTADLVRASTRGGVVRPRFLPTGDGAEAEAARARAAELAALFVAHVGCPRGELDRAVEDAIAGRPDFKLDRGLKKLLEDLSRFRGVPSDEAAARRAHVFRAAAAARRAAAAGAGGAFDRQAVLAQAAGALGVEPDRLEGELWGDLAEHELLEAVDAPGPEELVDRYNLALAQAMLLRATKLSVEVEGADPPRLRQLLRHVKFQGLLLGARRDGERVRLELDGPLSIFGSTPRYGPKMAGFLPALLLCPGWSLEARVQLGPRRREQTWRLDAAAGLRTRARDHGAWLPELVLAFARRFAEVAPGWTVDREVPLLNLGGEVVVPDFRFVHDATGWEGWLEVLGWWRKGAVAGRLQALAAHGAPRLVLALDQGLRLDAGALAGLVGPVVTFRELPDARKVKNALEDLRARDVAATPPRPARARGAAAKRAQATGSGAPPEGAEPAGVATPPADPAVEGPREGRPPGSATAAGEAAKPKVRRGRRRPDPPA